MDQILPNIYYPSIEYRNPNFSKFPSSSKHVNSVTLFCKKIFQKKPWKTNFIKRFFRKIFTVVLYRKILFEFFIANIAIVFFLTIAQWKVKTNFNSGLFCSNWTNMNRLYSTLYLSLQISKSSLCRDIYKRRQLLSQSMYNFIIFSLKIFKNDDLWNRLFNMDT